MSSAVRFAAMIPASCAVTSASPFGRRGQRRSRLGRHAHASHARRLGARTAACRRRPPCGRRRMAVDVARLVGRSARRDRRRRRGLRDASRSGRPAFSRENAGTPRSRARRRGLRGEVEREHRRPGPRLEPTSPPISRAISLRSRDRARSRTPCLPRPGRSARTRPRAGPPGSPARRPRPTARRARPAAAHARSRVVPAGVWASAFATSARPIWRTRSSSPSAPDLALDLGPELVTRTRSRIVLELAGQHAARRPPRSTGSCATRELARIDAGEIEQVGRELRQPRDLPLHRLDEPAVASRRRAPRPRAARGIPRSRTAACAARATRSRRTPCARCRAARGCTRIRSKRRASSPISSFAVVDDRRAEVASRDALGSRLQPQQPVGEQRRRRRGRGSARARARTPSRAAAVARRARTVASESASGAWKRTTASGSTGTATSA